VNKLLILNFKFYRHNKFKLSLNILGLISAYLSVLIILFSGNKIASNSLKQFESTFGESKYILTSNLGVNFHEDGSLLKDGIIEQNVLSDFYSSFPNVETKIINNNRDITKTAFLLINNHISQIEMDAFCERHLISIRSSLIENDQKKNNYLLYQRNGIKNRFNLFSFENQISALTLGKKLTSQIGIISRISFFIAFTFSIYLFLTYYKERRGEFKSILFRGFTDFGFKFIFVDVLLQNIAAIFLSIFIFVSIFQGYFNEIPTNDNIISSLLMFVPYMPFVILIQYLLIISGLYQITE